MLSALERFDQALDDDHARIEPLESTSTDAVTRSDIPHNSLASIMDQGQLDSPQFLTVAELQKVR